MWLVTGLFSVCHEEIYKEHNCPEWFTYNLISFVLGTMPQSLTARWANTQHLGKTFNNSYQ